MLDILPKALASVASFLFPLFASYKALKTADPAQLTPWLMYWVILSCVVLVESWTDWLLVWIPFYYYLRLLFLLYLVLPQTQGARRLYQTQLHPWLADHEALIDEFIGSAHDRLRSAGMQYLKQTLAYLRTALGLPGLEIESAQPPPASTNTPQGYTQALLARFTLPSARLPDGATSTVSDGTIPGATPSSTDLYNILSAALGALGAATGAAGGAAAGVAASAFASRSVGSSSSSSLTPSDRASFLAAQRDRLRALLSMLDREAAQATQLEHRQADQEPLDSESAPVALSRPPSGASGLSKSRSEADFEKIDAESGTEEEQPARMRKRRADAVSRSNRGPSDKGRDAAGASVRSASGSWMPWGWAGSSSGPGGDAAVPGYSQ